MIVLIRRNGIPAPCIQNVKALPGAHIALVRNLLLPAATGLNPTLPTFVEVPMFSLFGWTPSLRCLLRGKLLECGCSVGVYETRSGEIVQIVDVRASGCQIDAHSVDSVLAEDDEEPEAAELDHLARTH